MTLNINDLPKPWTKKQYQFALHYLADPNATEAAVKAGYSKKTSSAIACRMLRDVNFRHVQGFIASKAQEAIDQHEIKAEKTLKELACMAYSNMQDYIVVGSDGLPYFDMHKVTREQWAAVSKIKIKELPPVQIVENGQEIAREVLSVEISLWDKNRANETLGRYQKLEKAVEINVNHARTPPYDLQEFARRLAFILAKAAKLNEDNKPMVIEKAVIKDVNQ